MPSFFRFFQRIHRVLIRRCLLISGYIIWRLVRLVGRRYLTKRLATLEKMGWASSLIRRLTGKRNSYYQNNLKQVLPDLTDPQRDRIHTRSQHNMLLTAVESMTLDNTVLEHTDVIGLDNLSQYPKSTRFMFVSCHINNWEICRMNIVHQGFPLVAFFRDFSDQLFDHRRFNHRYRFDASVPTHQTRRYIDALAAGNNGFMMMDIKVKKGRNGLKIPFCGHPAWTTTFAADMALTHNLVIIPVHMERVSDTEPARSCASGDVSTTRNNPVLYRQIFGPAIHTNNSNKQRITSAINEYFSAVILKDPASWLLWDTNRWGP